MSLGERVGLIVVLLLIAFWQLRRYGIWPLVVG